MFFCFTIAALKTREPVLKNTGSLLKERDRRENQGQASEGGPTRQPVCLEDTGMEYCTLCVHCINTGMHNCIYCICTQYSFVKMHNLYHVNKQKKPIHRGESEVGEKRRDWGGDNIEAKK